MKQFVRVSLNFFSHMREGEESGDSRLNQGEESADA
jgi:hypothetical protein